MENSLPSAVLYLSDGDPGGSLIDIPLDVEDGDPLVATLPPIKVRGGGFTARIVISKTWIDYETMKTVFLDYREDLDPQHLPEYVYVNMGDFTVLNVA